MSKISKAFKAIIEIIKNPWLLNTVLDNDLVWLKHLAKTAGLEKGLPVIEIDELIPNFKSTINCFAFLEGGSLPTDVALLQSMASKFKDATYFEIGTWRGESVVNVANCAKEAYTLSLSKKELLDFGFKEKYADLHGYFSLKDSNIIHLQGNSLTYNFAALNKKFDVIFIDGDHHYESVKKDTENVFKHLVHDNSIVIWHDYAFNPEKMRPEVMSAIVDGTPKDKRSKLYHVSNTLCAIYINGSFKTHVLEEYTTPNKSFIVSVESKRL
jgi:predicted O-methyltransferase YrrM